jgi:polyphosphate kinase
MKINSKKHSDYVNREVSWLSFNERVLQEAADTANPLITRMRFLGIFANNLDEFFKVRVATLRRAKGISKKPIDPMDFNPSDTLDEIGKIVMKQQVKFEAIFETITTEMKRRGIHWLDDESVDAPQKRFLRGYFEEHLKPRLIPLRITARSPFPDLDDTSLYLAVQFVTTKDKKEEYGLIEIPASMDRFVILPKTGRKQSIILVDDVIRIFIHELFPAMPMHDIKAFEISTTRDAELDIDDDVSHSFIEKMEKSLDQRRKGNYVRLNYDSKIPITLLQLILAKMRIKDEANITAGGRYHRRRDFSKFPTLHREDLVYPKKQPISAALKPNESWFSIIQQKDQLLHFPYHDFSEILNLLREASIDRDVRTIRITLYRVAQQSQIVNALLQATRNGKRVLAYIELQARFDEEHNIAVINQLSEAGVRIIPSLPGLKVHCKLIQISRKEQNRTRRYSYIGTGNFHEETAKIYTDLGLLTASTEIGSEVRKVFDLLVNNFNRKTYRQLIISPFATRRRFYELIQHEIQLAQTGKPASITLKMNNLVDTGMIRKLYEASQSGVKIQLIIRGICSLKPGIKGLSENIKAISIVGRYLEHSRIFVFGNNGNPKYYISSADWMTRNIEHRIEVSAPILDKDLQQRIQDMLDIELRSDVKARLIDDKQVNEYRKSKGKIAKLSSQSLIRSLIERST